MPPTTPAHASIAAWSSKAGLATLLVKNILASKAAPKVGMIGICYHFHLIIWNSEDLLDQRTVQSSTLAASPNISDDHVHSELQIIRSLVILFEVAASILV